MMDRWVKWVFWASLLMGGALYAVMIVWSLPFVQMQAGGLVPFDLRPGGYTAEEARVFVERLSADGKSFYLNVQHRLDFFYPILLAVTLGTGMVLLAPPRWHARRWYFLALAAPGMFFDLAENHYVATMLRAPNGTFDLPAAESASAATLAKSVTTTVAMIAFLALLGAWVWRRWKSKA
jgi:hypothetical protein